MGETLDPAMPPEVIAKAEEVLRTANARDVKLATAESCTGGLLASLLTDVSGLSHVFERGFVCYSKDSKCDLLDIRRDLVENCGAVSKPVALAMAQGALARSRAGLAVSITGFAGPPGDGNEEGLVHLACARADGQVRHLEEHFGPIGRAGVRIRAIEAALGLLQQGLGS